MKYKILTLFMALLLIFSIHHQQVGAAGQDVDLTGLTPYDSESLHRNGWSFRNESFKDANNNVIINGLGFRGDTGQAIYNIKDEGYKSFKTSVSLDSSQIQGDYGKTAIGFYADDVLLYEKQLTRDSGVVDVNLSLPEKAKRFSIIVKQTKGSKGYHLVIAANPVFSTDGNFLKINEQVSPITIGSSEDSTHVYNRWNEWSNDTVFQDINDNVVTRGIGFGGSVYSTTEFATNSIGGMDYNQFVAKLSVDSKWTNGDYGKSLFAVYADDYLLYEKELTAKTPVQSLKLAIPKGTKNITFTTKNKRGVKGAQGIVLNNPLFKKTNDKLVVVPKTTAFTSLTPSEYSYHKDDWGNGVFQYSNGKLAPSGVGFYDGGNLTYNITNMGFNSLRTTLSLDSGWIKGDYGTSSVYFYADNKLLYSTKLKKSDVKNLTIRFPNATKKVKVYVRQVEGEAGYQGVVLGDARFTNLPISAKLSVNNVSITNNKNKDDVITVKSLNKKDVIKLYDSKGKQIASGTAYKTSVTLKIKQLGTKKGKVYFTRTSSGKLISDKTSVAFKAEKKK